MKLDPSRAVGAYAAVMTLATAWLALAAVAQPPRRFGTIDVERINVREPDGTLRLAIAGAARLPGIIVDGREIPHPSRHDAGMIFYNDEGTENGGLVIGGRMIDGRPTNGGSLTFDRWHQDQTIQLTSEEDGPARKAALVVNDRPDGPMDFAAASRVAAMPPGPARDAAIAAANFGVTQRLWVGRAVDGSAQMTMRDAAGRPRLRFDVAAGGAARIDFLDAQGRVTRSLR